MNDDPIEWATIKAAKQLYEALTELRTAYFQLLVKAGAPADDVLDQRVQDALRNAEVLNSAPA